MGQRDSSKTRVVPIFDRLVERDRSGKTWLPRLIKLNTCGNVIGLLKNCDFSIEEIRYGENEKRLDPPLSLLSWIIRYPPKTIPEEISSGPVKKKK